MNLTELEKKLLAVARATPSNDAVPYAFEKRIMARVQALRPYDATLAWGTALWRGALACTALALLCGVWAFSPLSSSPSDLSQDLEHAIMASADDSESTAW